MRKTAKFTTQTQTPRWSFRLTSALGALLLAAIGLFGTACDAERNLGYQATVPEEGVVEAGGTSELGNLIAEEYLQNLEDLRATLNLDPPPAALYEQVRELRMTARDDLIAYGHQLEELTTSQRHRVEGVIDERLDPLDHGWLADEIANYAQTAPELATELRQFTELSSYWNLDWVRQHRPDALTATSGS